MNGPVVHPPDDMSMVSHGGKVLTGENRITWRKTCPSTTSTINPTWANPGVNLDLCCEWPMTNHMSHVTAKQNVALIINCYSFFNLRR
jgi:hypothetical protein